MNTPPEYDEKLKLMCPFCRREVSAGTLEDGAIATGFHANPPCIGWTTASDIRQYMMFARLKANTDAGQRERN